MPTCDSCYDAFKHRAARPARQLRLLAIDSSDPDPVGGEPVLCGGRPVTRLTSAAFGYTVGHSLGLAYLPTDLAALADELEIDLLGSPVRARVLERPPYDPSGDRLRS